LDIFMATYTPCLREAVTFHPGDYAYPVEKVAEVAGRVRIAVDSGNYDHKGRAFRMTCGILGIKHTRKAIAEFLNS
jgi:hypothetical protein